MCTLTKPIFWLFRLLKFFFVTDVFLRRFLEYLSSMMSLLMTLAWIYSVCIIIKNIVYEKELRLKEVRTQNFHSSVMLSCFNLFHISFQFMKMMGLGNGVHWISWFINSFYLMLISSVILLLVLRVGVCFNQTEQFKPMFVQHFYACHCGT